MISFVFYRRQRALTGFDLSGHATAHADDEQGRIVCAAVSSAAYLTANTLTDVLRAEADAHDGEAGMHVMLAAPREDASAVLEGLLLHIEALTGQYPDNLKFSVLEAD